eukprot:9739251-Ditylum_brightwellii.AAC.1
MLLKLTRNVGMQSEIKSIEQAVLSKYSNDPLKMLDNMEMKYNHILDVSEQSVCTKKQFTIQVLRALLMTTDQDFSQYIKGKKDPFNE